MKYWLRPWWLFMTGNCPHPASKVTADILEGDGRGSVEWCRLCGSYRKWGETVPSPAHPHACLCMSCDRWRRPLLLTGGDL